MCCVRDMRSAALGRQVVRLWASEHKGPVRCVAQVSVDQVDRTKQDPSVATLVVVEVVTELSRRTRYRLACGAGVITTVYNRGDARLLPRSRRRNCTASALRWMVGEGCRRYVSARRCVRCRA
ncbi:MAG: hypothetical protein SGPRY_010700 [Prymnesium sp.]